MIDIGKGAAQLIAKRTGLPRSTVYSGLDSLADKGLVRKEERKGTTLFSVDDPKALVELIAKEREKVERRSQVANELAEQLQPLFKSTNYSVPRLEFIEGRGKVEEFLYRMLPAWRESIKKYQPISTWGYQDHSFVKIYNRWIEECWRVLHVEGKIPGRILSNISETERSLAGKIPHREVRVLDPEMQFTSSIWVMGDYITMIMTQNEPYYAFQIHDPVFAANLRELFRHLYSQSRPVVV